MSIKNIYDHGFGKTWTDTFVQLREGYTTSVTDYHEHGFYEINLILSGNVKILLGDRFEEGSQNRIVLTRPDTPHYISCTPDVLYSRLYLSIAREFIEDRLPEWNDLSYLFGQTGNVITLNAAQTEFFKSLLEGIRDETSPFRKRLLIYGFLSHLSELSQEKHQKMSLIPQYILDAIDYLENHYSEHFVSAELARQLHIGRTALMTGFKKHMGKTLIDYLTNCRLKHAVELLMDRQTLEYAAEKCGFADSSGLIRAFKRHYGMTPKQYIRKMTW